MSFAKIWKVFSYFFFKYFFNPAFFLFSFSNFNDINVNFVVFLTVAQIPEALLIHFFFQPTFPLLFRLANFYCSDLEVTDSFLCFLRFAFPTELFQSLYFSVLRFSFGSSLYLLFHGLEFFWSIVNLQPCASFRGTEKCIYIHIYTYASSFSDSFPI